MPPTSPQTAGARRMGAGLAKTASPARRHSPALGLPSRSLTARVTPTRPRPNPAYKALDALQNGHRPASPNFFISLVLAVVSLGALPALLWPLRFRRDIETERRALLELAQWGRRRLNETDGRQLVGAADRIRFAPSLMTLGMFGVVTALGALAWGLTQIPAQFDPFTWLLGLSYGALWPRFTAVSAAAPLGVFAVWTLGLAIAYTAHLVQVHLYALAVRGFLDQFNRLSIAEGYTPVLLEPIGFGFSPWILTAAAVLMLSGGWAIPMAFAGATDGRLRRRALPRMRKGLVGRVRDIIFATARPTEAFVPSFTRCATGGCGRPLGKGVKFCPRCGARSSRSLDRWI